MKKYFYTESNFNKNMVVVKITNREGLDKLIAKLTLRIGRKPTQQEVLNICIKYGEDNFENLISRLTTVPILDEKKIKKILAIADELQDVPWDSLESANWPNKDDKDVYSL